MPAGTPHLAALYNQPLFAGLILERGADANARDNAGLTPLRIATKEGHAEVADLLRQHGARE